jgi:hypothetical protein
MSNQPDIRRPQPVFLNLSPTLDGMGDLSEYAMITHTKKNLSTNAGTWEVTLAPSPYAKEERIGRGDFQNIVYQSIRPMDCIIIGEWGKGFNDDDMHSEQHFMFGFVDNVYRSYTSLNGRVEKTVNVRGRDATKLFAVDNIAYAPELATNPDLMNAFDNKKVLDFLSYTRGSINEGRNVFLNSYIPQAAYWILQNAPSMRIGLDYLQGKTSAKGNSSELLSPVDLFQTYLMARADEKIFSGDKSLNTYAGSILNYFSALVDENFYELWVDTVPYNSPSNKTPYTRPCLIIRPKPYDYEWEKTNSKGESLDNVFCELNPRNPLTEIKRWNDSDNGNYNWQNFTHPIAQSSVTINDEDITNIGLGISDEEVFSLFRVNGMGDVIGSGELNRLGLNFPLIDAMNMKAYGMRELSTESRLTPPSIDDLSQRYAAKLGTILDRDERNEFAKAWVTNISILSPGADQPSQTDYVRDYPKLFADSALVGLLTTDKRDRLWRWNSYNHLLESGQITIKGRNVFVGQKVISAKETNLFWTRGLFDPGNRKRSSHQGMEFYCEGVEQFGGWGQTWKTTLSLARGANMTELQTYYNQRQLGKAAGSANQIFTRNT